MERAFYINKRERRERVDNQILSILVTIQESILGIGNRLDKIDKRLDKIDNRLDGIDNRLDGIDNRLDGIDNRLDGIDDRLDLLELRLTDEINSLKKDVQGIRILVEVEVNRDIRTLITDGYMPMNKKLDALIERVDRNEIKMDMIKTRVDLSERDILELQMVR